MIELGRLAPGIGITHGDCARAQASVTRCGLTPRASATSANAACLSPTSLAEESPPSGDHGRNARPSSSQTSISGRLLRKAGENWFCTLASASPSTRWASRICSGSALEIPTISTLPESWISLRVSTTSA